HTRFSRDWSSDVCSSDLDPYGECAPPSCVRDSDCPAHHVCSHQDLCTPIAATPECGSLSPLTSLPLEVRTGAVERVTVGDLDGRSEERRVGKECGSGGRQ